MDEFSLNNREDLFSSSPMVGRTPFNSPRIITSAHSTPASPIEETDRQSNLRTRVRTVTNPRAVIDLRLITDLLNGLNERVRTPRYVIHEAEEAEEDVSEEFVTEFNKHYGNESNIEKAERLIKKMRLIGGLDKDAESILRRIYPQLGWVFAFWQDLTSRNLRSKPWIVFCNS